MKEKMSYVKSEFNKGIEQFKLGTKKMFKEFFNKETNKKQRANMWTFIRLIIPVITLICSTCAIIVSSPILLIITSIIAGFGAITDYFDGKSSRKHNSCSHYGKLLDQISDKVFAGVIGINLIFLNTNYILILLGELLISSINVGYKLKHHDLDITSTKIGKIKEWPLFLSLALGFLSTINPTLLTISNVSIILTFLFQCLTANSYIKSNQQEILNLKKKRIEENVELIQEENETKEKELVLEKEISNTNPKIESYKNLRNILLEVAKEKNDDEKKETINFQKQKKF